MYYGTACILLEQEPDGIITLEEFQHYFRFIAKDDTGNAETSPLACKALLALEYQPTERDKAEYTPQPANSDAESAALAETHRFWDRVKQVFATIDKDASGSITRDELAEYFKGNTAEADYYIDEMDGFVGDNEIDDQDGEISIEEWYATWLELCL